MILPDNQNTRRQAAQMIVAGGVIAFRTDTFYGLGADPFNAQAVRRIKDLKGREDSKPILLLISDAAEVDRLLIAKSADFDLLAKYFWPGPLTLIGRAVPNLPGEITAGTGTVGVRLPSEEQVRELVRLCGGVLTATSANPSRGKAAESAEEVAEYFPTGLDLLIDGGRVVATRASSVVDVSRKPIQIIREGAVSRGEVEEVLKMFEG